MLLGITTLAALRAFGDNDAGKLLFPEAEGVGGQAGALAHFLDSQSFIGHNRRAYSS